MRNTSQACRTHLPLAWFLALSLLAFCTTAFAQSSDTNALLNAWLNAQTNMQTWSADFVQTTTLQAMTQPQTATGHVWFAAPNRFRWELGNPPINIAVRQGDSMRVISPKLKRDERYSLGAKEAGQWKDMLALLDAGFPRSRAEVESRFNILAQVTSNGVHELTLQPKSRNARQFMPQLKIAFETNTFSLRSTEMQFVDRTMKSVFTNAVSNPTIDGEMFNPKDVPGYIIREPMKK